jgi:hypothetical protein
MEATLSTQEADAWSEDPATPAVRCIRRTLVSVGDAVRDVRVLLALCVERPCEGVRSPAAAICLDEAVVAVGALGRGHPCGGRPRSRSQRDLVTR